MGILKGMQSLIDSIKSDAVPGMDRATIAESGLLYRDYLRQAAENGKWWNITPTDVEAGRTILDSQPEFQIGVVFAGLAGMSMNRSASAVYATTPLLSQILRRRLPFTEAMLCALAERVAGQYEIKLHQGTARAAARYVQEHGLTDTLRAALRAWRDVLQFQSRDWRKLAATLDGILGVSAPMLLITGEPWGGAVHGDLIAMPPDRRTAWEALLTHCAASDAAKPSQKWLAAAKPLIDALGAEAYQAQIRAWFLTFANGVPPLLAEIQSRGDYRELSRIGYLVQQNGTILKGLVWCCQFLGAAMIAPLGDLALVSYKKIALHGPSSAKVGNACIQTLGALDDPAAVAQLSRLRLKISHRVAQSLIEKTLMDAAARLGVSKADLEEMALPTYGLDEQGGARHGFGDVSAEIAVTGMHATLHWLDGAGKQLKSVPASVERGHATEIKTLKATRAEIEKTLLAQRDRLESFYLHARDWSLTDWRERYLEHPLMGQIARRLIWQFQTQDGVVLGLWHAGKIADAQGTPFGAFDASTTVSLWHPLESSPETVLAWRERLETLNIVQPFKQAHREVYLLTDAERATRTYSNRFAAHIIKQHQFQALCRQRGWDYSYQGQWDSHNVPTRTLPQHDLRIEFFVEPAAEEHVSEAGIYLYLATDQVRFIHRDGGALPLWDVPPLVFSELMRDVDLFVGVGSVGNDPAWRDGGEQVWGRAYWDSFAFGDLSATAQTRRTVLERLVPRLKIAARCSFDGKFLTVRGDLRTYKIHLGSGNILMEPNDQYLCIVPGRSTGDNPNGTLFLPFEGDRTLSIILSKAFLLADDTKIKDSTIMCQIRP